MRKTIMKLTSVLCAMTMTVGMAPTAYADSLQKDTDIEIVSQLESSDEKGTGQDRQNPADEAEQKDQADQKDQTDKEAAVHQTDSADRAPADDMEAPAESTGDTDQTVDTSLDESKEQIQDAQADDADLEQKSGRKLLKAAGPMKVLTVERSRETSRVSREIQSPARTSRPRKQREARISRPGRRLRKPRLKIRPAAFLLIWFRISLPIPGVQSSLQ